MTHRDLILLVLFFAAIGFITVIYAALSVFSIFGRVVLRAATTFPGRPHAD